MRPTHTLRAGTIVAWSGTLIGAITGIGYHQFLFGHWGWLGYCSYLPVAIALCSLLALAHET